MSAEKTSACREAAKADLRAGMSVNQVVMRYGISKSAVARWRKEIKVEQGGAR